MTAKKKPKKTYRTDGMRRAQMSYYIAAKNISWLSKRDPSASAYLDGLVTKDRERIERKAKKAKAAKA